MNNCNNNSILTHNIITTLAQTVLATCIKRITVKAIIFFNVRGVDLNFLISLTLPINAINVNCIFVIHAKQINLYS